MDKKVYFKELKNDILKNLELVYEKNVEGKIEGIKNLESYVAELKAEIVDKLGIGSFDKKEVKKKIVIGPVDVKGVEKFGKDNNYPSMVLKRDKNGKITKKLGAGEKAWSEAVTWTILKEPYKSNFLDLVRAVEEKDIYDEKDPDPKGKR